jgi:GMP synthase-like glutamine amidotransferase
MKIHCLAHVPFEDAANIGRWAKLRGHSLTYTHFFKDETLPPMEFFDMLAIMGGLMNVYEHDEYPWLVPEKAFIRQAVNAGKKIIGVCLGAQLLADVLGGSVRANENKEIGWHIVKQTPEAPQSRAFSELPSEMLVFQWHGDTFSLPPGAVHLAENNVCKNQAFQYGENVLGLQFHMEYSEGSIEKMLTHCADELVEAPYINTPEQIRNGYSNIDQNTEWLYTLLDTFSLLP